MTDLRLSAHLPLSWAVALGLAAGLLAGLLHFRLLARNVRLFTEGRPAAALGLQAGRMLATLAVFVVLAWSGGAAALLSGLLGVLGARRLALRRVRREAR
jgi:hypothetical protein